MREVMREVIDYTTDVVLGNTLHIFVDYFTQTQLEGLQKISEHPTCILKPPPVIKYNESNTEIKLFDNLCDIGSLYL